MCSDNSNNNIDVNPSIARHIDSPSLLTGGGLGGGSFSETIAYLYNAAPAFTKVGASAYKEGLDTTLALDEHNGHPHREYLTVHVAGTNGKGSCSHTIAALLQAAGLKVGLYTSPHLVSFRERIRVNGEMIPEQYVVDWVAQNREFFEPLSPSFFELTTAMALQYFRDAGVDIAVLEVGLGGRLDCTNIISPILSVITNISYDHTQFLGDTLEKIAGEKAGIMKPGVPVIIGEAQPSVREVFTRKANEVGAPIVFAEDNNISLDCEMQLKGYYQLKNKNTVLNCLVPLARALKANGFSVTDATAKTKYAFAHVCDMTGLMGRWQTLQQRPLVICDTGHNVAGWEYLATQIADTYRALHDAAPEARLRMVFGMVDDKDIDRVMEMLPVDAVYYFTQASTHRAIPVEKVKEKATAHGLDGTIYNNVYSAYKQAMADANECDFVFIGGSSYIVADLLTEQFQFA